ncbi:hypothetical protein PR048_001693 [Dryococelus australis]|uniref:DDE-1 domain-containing protein n=1 Tax=Dryococelus australis TaxID=614101 RepID=A0ABQ9IJG1_9NEOP|nr:hypothetical protein PR048_001693 [Dryococelus australis]
MGKNQCSFTGDFKLKVVKYATKHSKKSAERHCDIDRKSVQTLSQQEEKVKCTPKDKQAFCGKQCKYPQLENELYAYIIIMHKEGFAVTTEIIHIEANSIARRMGISNRVHGELRLDTIGNANATLVWFDMPKTTTVERRAFPFALLERKTLPDETFSLGIIVRGHEKGWMTDELMVAWLSTVWNQCPGGMIRQRSLLVLDSFWGHLTDKVKSRSHSCRLNQDIAAP